MKRRDHLASGVAQAGRLATGSVLAQRLRAGDAGPEKPSDLFDDISALVDRGTLDQLGVGT
jgi:hypothetical protein